MSVDQSRATVFFDRDGTLNPDTSYIKTSGEFVLFPDAVTAVKRCNDAGILVLVVTNQSGLARGYFSQADLDGIHRCLREQLRDGGAWIDDIFICPHHPDDGCQCRKPNPGMIEQAMARYPIDLAKSYVVGDKSIDVELAAKTHVKGLLVTTGPTSAEELRMIRAHHLPVAYVAECLQDAVDWILADVECVG
ncbi:MAG: HAD family hydrolase [Nitrospinae bacterium]|nr:HAD family hydrolase [Nitrospinota bacterium]